MADFDVIVVGSGMSGGWVAKELCERGMKTLVLERGRDIDPSEDYTDMLDPWDKKYLDRVKPYEAAEGTDYEWYRGYHVDGRSLLWARMSYRLSDHDFNANRMDGIGIDWPIRYGDLEPWYDKVEEFAGVSVEKNGLGQLPDGKFLPPFKLDCAAIALQKKIAENFDDRRLITGRAETLKISEFIPSNRQNRAIAFTKWERPVWDETQRHLF